MQNLILFILELSPQTPTQNVGLVCADVAANKY